MSLVSVYQKLNPNSKFSKSLLLHRILSKIVKINNSNFQNYGRLGIPTIIVKRENRFQKQNQIRSLFNECPTLRLPHVLLGKYSVCELIWPETSLSPKNSTTRQKYYVTLKLRNKHVKLCQAKCVNILKK